MSHVKRCDAFRNSSPCSQTKQFGFPQCVPFLNLSLAAKDVCWRLRTSTPTKKQLHVTGQQGFARLGSRPESEPHPEEPMASSGGTSTQISGKRFWHHVDESVVFGEWCHNSDLQACPVAGDGQPSVESGHLAFGGHEQAIHTTQCPVRVVASMLYIDWEVLWKQHCQGVVTSLARRALVLDANRSQR